MADVATPESYERTAAVLAAAAEAGRSVRIAGAGTKSRWGRPPRHPDQILLSTASLDGTLEGRAGDGLVRVSGGVPFARLEAELAAAGRRTGLDPTRADAATVGGVVATDDAGPLAHRHGTPRDRIAAVALALADGSVIRGGAGVTRAVVGPDLPRLVCGSFGTLGVIVEVTLRTVPLPQRTLTVLGLGADAASLAAAAESLTAVPVEFEALDVAWRGGRGGLLAQVAGPLAVRQASRVAIAMRAAGLRGVEVTEDDAALWDRQRAGQRSADRAILRVSARPRELATVLSLADRFGATVVGRARRGPLFLELDPVRVEPLRAALHPDAPAVLLDLPRTVTGPIDVWGSNVSAPPALARKLKHAIDPHRTCNPGLFVDGI